MPKQLNSRCKELIASLIQYFEQERDNNGPLLPLAAVRERVAAALKINVSTVSTISQALKNNEVLHSPLKKRFYKKRVTNTVTLDTSAIRNTIYEMYERREQVTLTSLWQKLKENHLFNGCRMSLSTLLNEIGFKWKKDDPRRGMMEFPHIALKRVVFLRTYMKEKQENLYRFVFIDETWILQNGTIARSWQDDNKRSDKSTKVDGKRYIVLHAGNENGFVEGAAAIFSSKTQSSDYHGEMNQENFLKWFENQLLKHLTEPSLIVLNDAPYNSILLTNSPNNSWTKAAIQEWLISQNIQFSNTMFKRELLNIVVRNKPQQKYLVDNLAEQYGHKILRLPPYHCILNPIEPIWSIAKNYYDRHINWEGNTETDCLNMWYEALHRITPEIWRNAIQHTEDEIVKWYERERIFDREGILPIAINLDYESSDCSDFDSD